MRRDREGRKDGVPGSVRIGVTFACVPVVNRGLAPTEAISFLEWLLKNREELRSVKESLLRSNTRNVFVADSDGEEVAEFKAIQAVCQKIERRRTELEKTSGFEKLYHKVVAHYFGGMRRHLRALHPKLKPKASLAYVLGDQLSFLMVPIATAALLGEVAEAEGFKVVGRELWRERIGTKIRNSETNQRTVRVRDEILILEKN